MASLYFVVFKVLIRCEWTELGNNLAGIIQVCEWNINYRSAVTAF